MVGERISNMLDREPVLRKAESSIEGPLRNLRSNIDGSIEGIVPRVPNRNIGGGVGVGFLEAAVAAVIDEYVPLAAEADVVNVESTDMGMEYTVNVNAPFENMARARAFIDSGTGFTTILTDELDVQDVEVLKTRPLRDTYQIKLLIQD